MASAELRLQGAPELLAKLAHTPDLLLQLIERAVTAGLLQLQHEMAIYPLPPAGSTYHRTGTLGRLWTSDPPLWSGRPSGWLGSIGNATSYGPYVQDPKWQSSHNDAWRTTQVVLDTLTGSITIRIADAIAEAIDPLNS